MGLVTPFTTSFLSQFTYESTVIPFQNRLLQDLDQAVLAFEKSTIDPNLEKNLISKNELFASFAISKAENSALTLSEATVLWNLINTDPSYNFVSVKLKKGIRLTQKDHDKLEFINVIKTFRKYNERIYALKEYTPKLLLSIHEQLTEGLDIFSKYLTNFDLYKPGIWRDNDLIRVGNYNPPSYKTISRSLEELLVWIKQAPKIPTNIGIFHTALYAIHPFNNGNKRVCRIVEHMLYRTIGFNARNMYGTSYYYHLEKDRYYKNLLYSIKHHNLNQFTAYSLEALAYSLTGVFKTSLEIKKNEFLTTQVENTDVVRIFTPLIKRGEIQFKNLIKITKGKVSRPTLVTYLQKATTSKILTRREQGKNVYYSLNIGDSFEAKMFAHWINKVKTQLPYIPLEYKNQMIPSYLVP